MFYSKYSYERSNKVISINEVNVDESISNIATSNNNSVLLKRRNHNILQRAHDYYACDDGDNVLFDAESCSYNIQNQIRFDAYNDAIQVAARELLVEYRRNKIIFAMKGRI